MYRPIALLALIPALFVSAAMAGGVLTKEKVHDYLVMRVKTARLQMDMKRHASDYDDLPVAFFKKRDELLRENGWTPEEFKAVKNRIARVRSAMDFQQEQLRQLDEDATFMKNNRNIPAAQRKEALQAIEEQKKQAQSEIDATSSDQAAVEAWEQQIEQLTQWYNGNTDVPPKL